MQFSDGSSEVELRLQLGAQDIQSYRDISVDANDSSLKIRIQRYGSLITLIETDHLFEKIKPAETIWFVNDFFSFFFFELLKPVYSLHCLDRDFMLWTGT